MDEKKPNKIVYEDEGITKVLRGFVIKEDEYTYTIKTIPPENIIILGKRFLVKMEVF